MATLLEFRNVFKKYGRDTTALSDVSFSVEAGAFVSVIGPSGAGKSTLLRCINRMVDASRGEIVFDGINTQSLKKRDLRKLRTKIGMIFQHYNLVNRLSVIENVLHGNSVTSRRSPVSLGFIKRKKKDRRLSF